MSEVNGYTPGEKEVRNIYAGFLDERFDDDEYTEESAGIEFDTWLAKIKADAWDEAFEATCEAHDFYGGLNYTPNNPYR